MVQRVVGRDDQPLAAGQRNPVDRGGRIGVRRVVDRDLAIVEVARGQLGAVQRDAAARLRLGIAAVRGDAQQLQVWVVPRTGRRCRPRRRAAVDDQVARRTDRTVAQCQRVGREDLGMRAMLRTQRQRGVVERVGLGRHPVIVGQDAVGPGSGGDADVADRLHRRAIADHDPAVGVGGAAGAAAAETGQTIDLDRDGVGHRLLDVGADADALVGTQQDVLADIDLGVGGIVSADLAERGLHDAADLKRGRMAALLLDLRVDRHAVLVETDVAAKLTQRQAVAQVDDRGLVERVPDQRRLAGDDAAAGTTGVAALTRIEPAVCDDVELGRLQLAARPCQSADDVAADVDRAGGIQRIAARRARTACQRSERRVAVRQVIGAGQRPGRELACDELRRGRRQDIDDRVAVAGGDRVRRNPGTQAARTGSDAGPVVVEHVGDDADIVEAGRHRSPVPVT